MLQAFQWIFCARAINRPSKEIFSQIARWYAEVVTYFTDFEMIEYDDKSKQGYKVKINKIQEYDPYQIRKEELSGHISNFPPVQPHR